MAYHPEHLEVDDGITYNRDTNAFFAKNIALSLGSTINEISNDASLSDSTSSLLTEHAIRAYSINQTQVKSGLKALLNGDSTITVVFVEVLPNINYAVGLSIVNIVDNPPSIYNYIVKNKTTTGFDVVFSGEMDSDNYVLEWMVDST